MSARRRAAKSLCATALPSLNLVYTWLRFVLTERTRADLIRRIPAQVIVIAKPIGDECSNRYRHDEQLPRQIVPWTTRRNPFVCSAVNSQCVSFPVFEGLMLVF